MSGFNDLRGPNFSILEFKLDAAFVVSLET